MPIIRNVVDPDGFNHDLELPYQDAAQFRMMFP